MHILLEDNCFTHNTAPTFQRVDVAHLFSIADKTISQLCEENEHLLIFPYSIKNSADKIEKANIINIQCTSHPDNVRVCTGNIMGFFGIGNLQVKIKSRFDNDDNDFLLHYMLQRTLTPNIFNFKHNSEDDSVFDFAMLMFPFILKRALRQGVYREYHDFKHNDSNLNGAIDFNRQITQNMPFTGKFAYTTRENSHNNSMTQLIRHTIELIKTTKFGSAVLSSDRECAENVQIVRACTTSYRKSERESIISKNLRHKCHPYYTEYQALQTICLQILRKEEIKYGNTDNEIYGILFDGAWLWEEYVNTILREYGFKHPENKNKKGCIYLFDDNTGDRYPDFYKEGIVLDAKYKRIGDYNSVAKVDRDDIHQIITYMTALKAHKGGFISPLNHQQVQPPTKTLKGSSATLSIYGIEICKKVNTYADFCQKMKENEKKFIASLEL